MNRPIDLPEFDAPPLAEVVLSIQFDSLQSFQFVHVGSLYDQYCNQFPIIQYQPTLLPVFETFGLGSALTNRLHLQFADRPAIPRLWFVNRENSELVQFQPDRLTHNWRKIETDQSYPRYETLRQAFLNETNILIAYLSEQNLGPITPNQCEVSYVNIIRAAPNGVSLKQFSRVDIPSVGPFEDGAITARYQISGNDGAPVGRIMVQSTPAVDHVGEQVTHLTITGRGPPLAPTIEAAFDFLDQCHVSVVRAFAAVTTDELQLVWKRRF